MRKVILTLFISCVLALVGCANSPWLYRVNIQQGNVITADQIHQLHIGMTKEAVCDLIGPPILQSDLNDCRWSYIYTFKSGKGKCIRRSLVLYFRNNHLSNLNTQNIKE